MIKSMSMFVLKSLETVTPGSGLTVSRREGVPWVMGGEQLMGEWGGGGGKWSYAYCRD